MAGDMVGFHQFAVVGHDRGGRVAYRLALDHPTRISALAVLDIIPTEDAWQRADADLALTFWPWSLLAQPEPLPERLLPSAVRAAYIEALRDPARAHAICEEYRAATTLDREHDRRDRQNGRLIECPLLVLWSSLGALDKWYRHEGGPLSLWKNWGHDVTGQSLEAGHFFPEEKPEETSSLLIAFLEKQVREKQWNGMR